MRSAMPITPLPLLNTFRLSQSQLVSGECIGVALLSECKQDIALYAEGLNPCIAIVMHGELDFVIDDDQDNEENEPIIMTESFVCMNHTPGPKHNFEGSTAQFCYEEIERMFAQIELKTAGKNRSLLRATLFETAILRCVQIDEENPQEMIAAELKQLLSDKDFIDRFNADKSLFTYEIELSEQYGFVCLEEKEKFLGNESDALHVFLQKSPNNVLNMVYCKSFLTLDVLFQTIEQQKIKLLGKQLAANDVAEQSQAVLASASIMLGKQ
jgi:hypothetical protein